MLAECVGERDTIETAAKRLAELDVGSMPICGEDDRLKGMVTDRDIVVKVIAKGDDPTKVTAGDLAAGTAQNGAATGALAAKLLTGENGARLAMIETGGWDTHSGQRGRLNAQLRGLDQMVGALQILGAPDRPVEQAHLDRLDPLVGVLSALLIDVAALARRAPPDPWHPTPPPRTEPSEVVPGPETTRFGGVPVPRRQQPSPLPRHRLET